MKLSELIQLLQSEMDQNGDLIVMSPVRDEYGYSEAAPATAVEISFLTYKKPYCPKYARPEDATHIEVEIHT